MKNFAPYVNISVVQRSHPALGLISRAGKIRNLPWTLDKGHRMWTVVGALLFVAGITFLIKPDVFSKMVVKRTSLAQMIMSPSSYLTYMRLMGGFYVALGLFFIFAY